MGTATPHPKEGRHDPLERVWSSAVLAQAGLPLNLRDMTFDERRAHIDAVLARKGRPTSRQPGHFKDAPAWMLASQQVEKLLAAALA